MLETHRCADSSLHSERQSGIVSVQINVLNWRQFNTRFLFVDPAGMLITDGQKVIQWEDEGDPGKTGEGDNVWTGNGWYF